MNMTNIKLLGSRRHPGLRSHLRHHQRYENHPCNKWVAIIKYVRLLTINVPSGFQKLVKECLSSKMSAAIICISIGTENRFNLYLGN